MHHAPPSTFPLPGRTQLCRSESPDTLRTLLVIDRRTVGPHRPAPAPLLSSESSRLLTPSSYFPSEPRRPRGRPSTFTRANPPSPVFQASIHPSIHPSIFLSTLPTDQPTNSGRLHVRLPSHSSPILSTSLDALQSSLHPLASPNIHATHHPHRIWSLDAPGLDNRPKIVGLCRSGFHCLQGMRVRASKKPNRHRETETAWAGPY
ncbi:hypothetical protein DFP72DRAFT_552800 [Ephemerocybe angulata]|uniref:Uncharacterized protein n=1 Tax=Ephemerocybe angulata TaxID=980116 RepID=A0A8H6HMC7_9AGAR|nr:hypothetical protein DFP72DRAFT_552800 [Tulosesus angulatus]